MREININVRLIDNSPVLGCADANAIIGAMWDNRAQELVFTRDSAFDNYNMMLSFATGGEQIDVNIGTDNTYTVTNALTQNSVLQVRVSFYEDTTFLYGSVNTLRFMYTKTGQIGDLPAETINQYLELLAAAEAALEAADITGIQSSITSLNDSLANLLPGGTNILRNTNTAVAFGSSSNWDTGAWATWNTGGTSAVVSITDAPNPDITYGRRITTAATAASSYIQHYIPLVSGMEYTLSCYVRLVSGSGRGYIAPRNDNSSALIDTLYFEATTEWQRISFTFAAALMTGAIFASVSANSVIEICGEKLELGNKATDWSLSPWDVTNRLTKLETAVVALGGTI